MASHFNCLPSMYNIAELFLLKRPDALIKLQTSMPLLN